ncbi:MAG TPA: putative cytokinetic ring protein SteA [Acidimicrobiales bacterium]|nr:putative cytokinetic ring protein SteA [Acidimicrobiales bacterium]
MNEVDDVREPSDDADLEPARGPARIDRRTKDLVSRLKAGDVAVIHHEDLDRVAAETLIRARPAAVVNAAASISGRYPNLGPLLVCAAGIPLLDGVGEEFMAEVTDGTLIEVVGSEIRCDGRVIGKGRRQSIETLEAQIAAAKATMGAELEAFAENTLNYLRTEQHLLLDDPDVPEVRTRFEGRQVLVVARGPEYKDDLALLRRSGYLNELKPVSIAVDGGADALLDLGIRPDIIIGDFDSVSEKALRCGAELVVHGYRDGRAPGAARLEELGLDYLVYASEGTSEDIAMLLAFEEGAELIVAVGSHSSMVEFLEKGRPGMASTFLVRLKVGPILVDAKGVNRLYRQTTVRKADLAMVIGAAMLTFLVFVLVSEPLRLTLRIYWTSLTQ